MTDYALKQLRRLRADRRGVMAMEYAILAGAIAPAILAGFKLFGGDLNAAFASIAALVPPV